MNRSIGLAPPGLWATLLGVVLALLGLGSAARANGLDPDAQAAARLSRLADHPTWRALIQVPPGGSRSAVLSPDFFLSPTHPGEPQAELEAALSALDAPFPPNANEHARCRFPARYLWLSKQLALPGYVPRDRRCLSLERWARFDDLRSASLLLVAGYFDNPASTFGHAFFRLNTDQPDSLQSLLDLAISFGALIPPDEAVAVYVVKGLAGGYESGFSDKYFYTHDLVYTRTEARDLWEYELELDAAQLETLASHLFELLGRKYTYYFLSRNCAFRLAEVLELVTGRQMTQRASVWFTPVELFHRLHEADAAGPDRVIRKVRHVPSAERRARYGLAALEPPLRAWVARATNADAAELRAMLSTLETPDRQAVLDVLLQQAQISELAQQPEVPVETRRRTALLLRLRLALPVNEAEAPLPPERPSPATRSPPASLGLGWLHDSARDGPSLLLRGAAFDYGALDEHGLEGGELAVLDMSVSIDRHATARLEQIDVMRVRKLNLSPVRLGTESGWSWHTVIGASRHGHAAGDRLRAAVTTSGGWARSAGRDRFLYALAELGVYGSPMAASVGLRMGVQGRSGDWSASAEVMPRRERAVSERVVAHPGFTAVALSALYRREGSPWSVRWLWSRDHRTRVSMALLRAS